MRIADRKFRICDHQMQAETVVNTVNNIMLQTRKNSISIIAMLLLQYLKNKTNHCT